MTDDIETTQPPSINDAEMMKETSRGRASLVYKLLAGVFLSAMVGVLVFWMLPDGNKQTFGSSNDDSGVFRPEQSSLGCAAASSLELAIPVSIPANLPDPVAAERCYAQQLKTVQALGVSAVRLGHWYRVKAAKTGVLSVRFKAVNTAPIVKLDLYRGTSCSNLFCGGRSTLVLDDDAFIKWEVVRGETYYISVHFEYPALDHFTIELVDE